MGPMEPQGSPEEEGKSVGVRVEAEDALPLASKMRQAHKPQNRGDF